MEREALSIKYGWSLTSHKLPPTNTVIVGYFHIKKVSCYLIYTPPFWRVTTIPERVIASDSIDPPEYWRHLRQGEKEDQKWRKELIDSTSQL